jgi:protein-L-isoaspartate(D-aspartate) O-methyltransferase
MGAGDLAAAARAAGVRDERVLAAITAIPRGPFLPPAYAASAGLDEPVPIGEQQVTTQPSLTARMLEGLALTGSEQVLEVGTGYGWQTALLARLARHVISIETRPALAAAARANLAAAGISGAEVITGDGTGGWPPGAPYDAVLVSAAYPRVPAPLAEQLAEGGRLVQPIGPGGDEIVTAFTKRAGRLVRLRALTGARFVPLVGRYAWPAGS